jgi:hypothetical protein
MKLHKIYISNEEHVTEQNHNSELFRLPRQQAVDNYEVQQLCKHSMINQAVYK